MKTYSTDQLKEIRKLHQLWLQSKEGGVRADLSNAYLSNAYFSGAYLSDANFSGAIGQPPTDDELLKIRDGACTPGAEPPWVALAAAWLAELGGPIAGAKTPPIEIPYRDEKSSTPALSEPPPPYSSAAIAWQAEDAQRIYQGAMWRDKEGDVWHPLGEPIDFMKLARQQLNSTISPPRESPADGEAGEAVV